MIAKFCFNDIVAATNARVIKAPEKDCCNYKISTDTRTISNEDVFLPLSGANFDGHNFINKAVKEGISAYFIDKKHNETDYNQNCSFILEVEDTLIALLSIASYHRKRQNAKIIAITGSSGKTTTKEIIYSVLSQKFNTQKSELNFNNEIGVSKTLLSIEDNTEAVVLEMGMRGFGEIDLLAKFALPDISVITNVGSSHIGRLGSLENIAKAKTEILNYFDSEKNQAFLYGEDKLLISTAKNSYNMNFKTFGNKKDYSIQEISENKTVFTYKNEHYQISVPGEHNVVNSSVAIEIAKSLEMSHSEINEGLKSYKPIFGRWEEYNFANNIRVINDAYNANPDSTKASIETILSVYPDKKKYLIIGDMLELGNYEIEMHSNIGKWLKNKQVDKLITVGKLAKHISDQFNNSNNSVLNFNNSEKVAEYISSEKINDTVILLKASRSVGLEKVLEKIKEQNGGGNH